MCEHSDLSDNPPGRGTENRKYRRSRQGHFRRLSARARTPRHRREVVDALLCSHRPGTG